MSQSYPTSSRTATKAVLTQKSVRAYSDKMSPLVYYQVCDLDKMAAILQTSTDNTAKMRKAFPRQVVFMSWMVI